MLLAKIQGGEVTRYPYSLALLRADNLNVSLSDAPSAKTLARLNAVQVTRTPMPLADHTKTVTEGKPVFRDGAWHQVWIVTDASQAEVESIMNMRREAIRQERDARLERGFIYDFGLGRGPHLIGTTPSDMRGWDEVTKLGQAALNIGQPEMAITIKTGTGMVQITAQEWQGVLLAAAAFRQPIFAADFALRAMPEPPEDFADDKYWP
jgi:hypothetical protein